MCAATLSTGVFSDLAPTLPERDDVDPISLTSEAVPAVDRYTDASALGQGGMGEVRMCLDHRTRRHIAMKVMRPELVDKPGAKARFVREALAQSRLEHPSIVPVYDVNLDAGDELYFTMRRVQGPTLEEVLRHLAEVGAEAEKDYSRHRLLSAFASVCLAVHYAHTRDVLHCDLKPSNIMLGAFGEVYVLDWGLAARATQGSGRVPEKSVARALGTIGYMPPERLLGVAPDVRADVYALGATLYEILTLERLHRGTRAEIRERTLGGALEEPSRRAPRRDIAPELDAICMKATATNPSHRYASVRELHDALERYLAGDRDLVLRRELSKGHTREALVAIERSQSGDGDGLADRSDALRAVGRALAFDPENKEALHTLVGLITDAPAKLPAEALSEIMADERVSQRTRARAGVAGTVIWLILLPLFLWLGAASVRAVLACMIAYVAVAFVLYRRSRHPTPDGCAPPHEVVLSAIAVASTSLVANPYVTAAFATVASMGFSLASRPRHRQVPLVAFGLSVIVPWSFEAATSPQFANPLILVVILANMLVGCLYVGRFRQRLGTTQRRAYTTTWQLRQLLPRTLRSSAPKL
jgi:serine/threonine-protein kinase